MICDEDVLVRSVALENAVKATSGYKSGGMSSIGTDMPGTPPADAIVERAKVYYGFLTGKSDEQSS